LARRHRHRHAAAALSAASSSARSCRCHFASGVTDTAPRRPDHFRSSKPGTALSCPRPADSPTPAASAPAAQRSGRSAAAARHPVTG
jgi:hypothetical protein